MIPLPHTKGQSFYVFGLGKSGLSAAHALIESGAHVQAWDDEPESIEKAKFLDIPVTPPDRINWSQQKGLILSPGIPHTYPTPHPVATLAKEYHVPILCDVELLLQARPQNTFIGITGSNGKSTTTALIAHILKEAGLKVQEGGNLGIPALDLTPLDEKGVYVLELSSFQLDLCFSPSLKGAIFINVTKNHLDRHGGMEGYIESKKRIFKLLKPKGKKVIGVDSDDMQKICQEEQGLPISATHKVPGIFVEKGHLIDARTQPARSIMDLNSLENLKGTHNFQNIAAAFAILTDLDLATPDQIIHGIKTFQGLPHRQEIVARFKNILFVNDSKATTLEASIQSIQQFEPIYWIVGGVPKEGFEDISALKPYESRIQKAFLIGQSSHAYYALFHKKFDCLETQTLEKATQAAFQEALKNPAENITILLAPACASYDQFDNFEHRGNVFKKYVANLIGQS
ncbi:MAG: UDP-N-acetylmuramoyl-L-alanine--D-glutamate ligase [Alphaproteobacteria bacterium]